MISCSACQLYMRTAFLVTVLFEVSRLWRMLLCLSIQHTCKRTVSNVDFLMMNAILLISLALSRAHCSVRDAYRLSACCLSHVDCPMMEAYQLSICPVIIDFADTILFLL